MIIFYCLIQNKIEIIFVDYFSIYYYNKLLTILKFYNSLKKLISSKDLFDLNLLSFYILILVLKYDLIKKLL